MEPSRLLDCLAADHARLRAVVADRLADPVPTCPGWTVSDLVRHVGAVYLHKTECIVRGVSPEPWPPPGVEDEEPLALLDRGYGALTGQFAGHAAGDPAYTWYAPDQTVGFWIRRMAQETVIHRVDAELAAGVAVDPIPDDLAEDGIDEVLQLFLGYGATAWPEDFAAVLRDASGRRLRVRSPGGSWLVRTGTDGVEVTVEDPPAGGAAPDADPGVDATVSGDATPLLLWLWNRDGDATLATSGDTAPTASGDTAAVAELRAFMTVATV